jgi:hypothetical protein
MVNVASPTFNGAVASADSDAKAVMDGEPQGAKAEACSIIRTLAIQHLGMAVDHPLRDRGGRLLRRSRWGAPDYKRPATMRSWNAGWLHVNARDPSRASKHNCIWPA